METTATAEGKMECGKTSNDVLVAPATFSRTYIS